MARCCIWLSAFIVALFVYVQSSFGSEIYFTVQEKAAMSILFKVARDQTYSPKLDLADISADVISQLHLEPETIEVENFQQFIAEQKLDTIFLDHKLEQLSYAQLGHLLRPKIYVSSSARVQNKIDAYNAEKKQLSLDFYSMGFDKVVDQMVLVLNSPDAKIDKNLIQDVKARAAAYSADVINKITTNMVQESTSNEVKILARLIQLYFKYLPLKIRLNILYDIIQRPANATKPLDLFMVFLQNAGPQLQKLLQIKGRDGKIPANYQELFQKLESQVKAVPWIEMLPYLEANGVDLSRFIYIERKPLGIGTMAQSHRAQSLDDNGVKQSFIIRSLKPGIHELVEMDHFILSAIAKEIDNDPAFKIFNLPSMKKIVDDINKSVVEELDVQATVRNQKRGEAIYNRVLRILYSGQPNYLKIHVPASEQIGTNVMLQELVFGRKPEKESAEFIDAYPDLYRSVAEAIASVWIDEAFFKSGYFHADLHQGNMMMKFADQNIDLNKIDFGMVGDLPLELRRSILTLNIGTIINNPEIIANSYIVMADAMNPEQSQRFKDRVNDKVISLGRNKLTLEEWTKWAIEQGINLNYEFLKLNRGIVAIKSLLADAKATKSFEQLVEAAALKNKIYVFNAIRSEKLIGKKEIFEWIKTTRRQGKALSCESLFLTAGR